MRSSSLPDSQTIFPLRSMTMCWGKLFTPNASAIS